MKEMSDLICGKTAVGGNYNSTRDSKGAGSKESYAVYMKEDSPRYGEIFHLGDYLPGGDFFVGANSKEHGIADNRKLLRKSDNGELGEGTTVTQSKDGKIHIVID